MQLDIWMCNTKPEEKERTLKFLEAHHCTITKMRTATDSGGNEFSFSQWSDCDEDILDNLAVTLFYNDRNEAEIELIKIEMRKLLVQFPRSK